MLKKLYPTTVKGKFLTIIFLAFLLIITLGVYINYQQQYQGVIEAQKFISQSNYQLVTSLIQSKASQARAIATMCAATSENAKAVADKDTPRLRDLTLSKFIYMKKEFNLSQLQFHLPPATSLFRAHEPDKFGDDLSYPAGDCGLQ